MRLNIVLSVLVVLLLVKVVYDLYSKNSQVEILEKNFQQTLNKYEEEISWYKNRLQLIEQQNIGLSEQLIRHEQFLETMTLKKKIAMKKVIKPDGTVIVDIKVIQDSSYAGSSNVNQNASSSYSQTTVTQQQAESQGSTSYLGSSQQTTSEHVFSERRSQFNRLLTLSLYDHFNTANISYAFRLLDSIFVGVSYNFNYGGHYRFNYSDLGVTFSIGH